MKQIHDLRDFFDRQPGAEPSLLATFLEMVDALVVVLDADGRIAYVNPASERVTGFAPADVTGRMFWEFLPAPAESDAVVAAFKKMTSGGGAGRYENYWLTKDGGRRYISWSNTCLVEGVAGVRYVVATGIDFTERRRAEDELRQHREALEQLVEARSDELTSRNTELHLEMNVRRLIEGALRQSERHYRTLIESLPQDVFHKDRDLVYLYSNVSYARRFDLTPVTLPGKTDANLYPADIAAEREARDRMVIESGAVFETVEYYLLNGETRIFRVVRAPVRDDRQAVAGILGIAWDITEFKRAAARNEAAVAKPPPA